jgi:hypothetical protein
MQVSPARQFRRWTIVHSLRIQDGDNRGATYGGLAPFNADDAGRSSLFQVPGVPKAMPAVKVAQRSGAAMACKNGNQPSGLFAGQWIGIRSAHGFPELP